jgi:hypothetical protein
VAGADKDAEARSGREADRRRAVPDAMRCDAEGASVDAKLRSAFVILCFLQVSKQCRVRVGQTVSRAAQELANCLCDGEAAESGGAGETDLRMPILDLLDELT